MLYSDNFFLEVGDFSIPDDAFIISEASWMDKYERRALTREESSRLRVPKAELKCSVMYLKAKRGDKAGFVAYTHRCMSKFFPRPEDIPVKTLKFISSTA